MEEKWKVIGMNDKYEKEFNELLENGCLEAKEMKNGYSNPLIVANILKCKIKCLENKFNEQRN